LSKKKRSRDADPGSASALIDPSSAPHPADFKPVPFPAIPVQGNAIEVWDQFFATHKPQPIEFHKPFKSIFELKDHDGAVAFLEAAIRHGQGRTWMYEVLPLEMQLAERSTDDIERAMLSRSDFRTVDQSSMMLSAAYLVRFQQLPRALHLYRQASSLNPARPEPYALGLRLAKELDDADAVQWAGLGILSHVWTTDHQSLHRQAENALLDLEQELSRAGKTAEAKAVSENLAAAKTRDLEIILRWQGEADLDLIIEEPNGTLCSLQHPQSPAGGILLHDGMGPRQRETYEQIVYPQALTGTYRIKIQHVWGRVVAKRALLTVTRYKGTDAESSKTQVIALNDEETVVRVQLKQGRRTQPAAVSAVPNMTQPPVPVRNRSRIVQTSAQGRQARDDFLKTRRLAQPGRRRAGASYQPVISIIPEGSSLSASAVISADRRYVRMRLTPTFSQITDVFTFSFLNNGGGNR